MKTASITSILLPYHTQNKIEGGVDEVGRGCIAGRVYAAIVIPPPAGFSSDLANQIRDSKKLSKKKREILQSAIKRESLDYCIGYCEPSEIDQINILQATFLAMNRAITKIKTRPEHIIVDGNRFVDTEQHQIPYKCIIKGDDKYQSIAAASIVAKYERDTYVLSLLNEDKTLKVYGWETNMGYPTPKHKEALKSHGLSCHHRKTFGPCKSLIASGKTSR